MGVAKEGARVVVLSNQGVIMRTLNLQDTQPISWVATDSEVEGRIVTQKCETDGVE